MNPPHGCFDGAIENETPLSLELRVGRVRVRNRESHTGLAADEPCLLPVSHVHLRDAHPDRAHVERGVSERSIIVLNAIAQ